jgi:hypothetical protein
MNKLEEERERDLDREQNQNGTKEKNLEKTEEEYIKVTVTKGAEKAVTDLLLRVNDGYEGGRVTRQDLLSWILKRFGEECSDQEIRAIRLDHFDEIALLELSLKKFKQAGSLPPELKKLLMAQAGIDEVPKAKRLKAG